MGLQELCARTSKVFLVVILAAGQEVGVERSGWHCAAHVRELAAHCIPSSGLPHFDLLSIAFAQ